MGSERGRKEGILIPQRCESKRGVPKMGESGKKNFLERASWQLLCHGQQQQEVNRTSKRLVNSLPCSFFPLLSMPPRVMSDLSFSPPPPPQGCCQWWREGGRKKGRRWAAFLRLIHGNSYGRCPNREDGNWKKGGKRICTGGRYTVRTLRSVVRLMLNFFPEFPPFSCSYFAICCSALS